MKKLVSIFILVCFIITGQIGVHPVYAQDVVLPKPGAMVHLSPEYNPPILKGLKVHPDNPFRFDFILDQGDEGAQAHKSTGTQEEIKSEAAKLIKYFLASLTIPEKDLWVNLSPYEKDRIIPQSFGLTEMGRDLLAEDYMLKQITASLIYPEDDIGKKFWKRIYQETAKKFSTTNIPVNTFNKIWIIPEKAVVYENVKAGTAYVVEAKLKVMLEQDYLALSKNVSKGPIASLGGRWVSLRGVPRSGTTKQSFSTVIPTKAGIQDTSSLGSQIVREIIIPELTKEVNEGKNFSQLRQVYNSLILATWYKKKIKDSILQQVYADKNKIAGINYRDKGSGIRDKQGKLIPYPLSLTPSDIYNRYLQAFKKGAYNYIKEEIDPATQQSIPKKYFSGGFGFNRINQAMIVETGIDQAELSTKDNLMDISADLTIDHAQASQLPSASSRQKIKPSVLVLITNETQRKKVESALDKRHYSFIVAKNGTAALEIMQMDNIFFVISDSVNAAGLLRSMQSDEYLKTIPVMVRTGLVGLARISGKDLKTLLPLGLDYPEDRKYPNYISLIGEYDWPTLENRLRISLEQSLRRNSFIIRPSGISGNVIVIRNDQVIFQNGQKFSKRFVYDVVQSLISSIQQVLDENPHSYNFTLRADWQYVHILEALEYAIGQTSGGLFKFVTSRTNQGIEITTGSDNYENRYQVVDWLEGLQSAINDAAMRTKKDSSGDYTFWLDRKRREISSSGQDAAMKGRKDGAMISIQIPPDEKSSKTGQELAQNLKEYVFGYRPDAEEKMGKRDAFILKDAILRGGNKITAAIINKLEQQYGSLDISKMNTIDLTKLLYMDFAKPVFERHMRRVGEIILSRDKNNLRLKIEKWFINKSTHFTATVTSRKDFFYEAPFIREVLRKLKELDKDLIIVPAVHNNTPYYTVSYPEDMNHDEKINRLGRVLQYLYEALGDKAQFSTLGGIDLTSDKALSIQNNGQAIKFHIDPAMLQQLQNAPGFVPVIINIQPLKSLPQFLGIDNDKFSA